MKGASRIIAIDHVPERLERAKEQGCEVIDFSIVKDVGHKVHEMVPGGLDVALDCGESARNTFSYIFCNSSQVHSTSQSLYFTKG